MYKNLLLGFIAFLILIMMILMIYVKVKHKFWSIQPVFHVYSIRNWLFPKGIINEKLPLPNKFCDFFSTKTIKIKELEDSEAKKYKSNILFFSPELSSHFTNFVEKNYLQTKNVQYSPSKQNIIPYFKNHNHPSYLTYYINQINNINSIAGYITSRPLEVFLDGYNLLVYYVDYLCVDKNQRKKGMAPNLIQSHIYNQRHDNKLVDIILFKRETRLNLLVPLTIYMTYGFDLYYWKIPKKLAPGFTILRITTDNFYFCREMLYNMAKTKFKCTVFPNTGNFLHLIETKNLILYSLMQNKELIAIYIFRDECTTVNDKKIVGCIGTISNCTVKNLFVLGFHHCLFDLRKRGFLYVNIENISNNDSIIENIITKYTPNSISKTAYYFYNFAVLPKLSKEVLIIS